jgi:hypothetical protein
MNTTLVDTWVKKFKIYNDGSERTWEQTCPLIDNLDDMWEKMSKDDRLSAVSKASVVGK